MYRSSIIPRLIAVFVWLICINISAQDQGKPNVIVIICDDLNDAIHGMGGHPQAITPNIDLGYDLAKANTLRALTSRLGLGYHIDKWSTNGSFHILPKL
jgi:hypothetical protein